MWAGKEAACEVGVHAMRAVFQDTRCEAVLLVDASNSFNMLNHQTSHLNIDHLCPSLTTVLTNTYIKDSSLFIEGETLLSSEGATQADPLATASTPMLTWRLGKS